MSNIAELNAELDRMVLSGQAMEAFEKFYTEDLIMQENTAPPTVGKAANREREIAFFSSIEQFHGAQVLSSGAGDNVSFAEVEMDVTFKGGPRVTLTQVAVRRWKDGQIYHERFYYSKG
ncbi:MAG: nuclear transport factor 2 family protein [Acidobacteria bacterium]|nr:nuclear transport factor 2 family protein [Acidobacteriota bacterium]